MGKGMKAFLITACVCILVGMVMLIGVLACGGKDAVAQAINGGVYFSQDGFHVGGMKIFEDTANMEFDIGKEMEFAADEIENLDLELAAGTFEIVEADTDKIIIRSAKKIRAGQSGKTLEVDTDKGVKVNVFGVTNEGNHVEITLPKGKNFHKIDLEVGAGQLNATPIISDEIEMEIGAGSIISNGFVCKKAKISVGAGEAIVNNGAAGYLDLDVGLGDLQYTGSLMGDLDADCGMGNMDIDLDGLEEDYNYQIDVGMGDISVGHNRYGGMAQSKDIDNDADKDMDLDCGMGSINIKF